MAKTKEELTQLKEEYNSLTTKLKELTGEELDNISGGSIDFVDDRTPKYEKPITSPEIPENIIFPEEESS